MHIYLLHGLNGSPDGTVKRLKEALAQLHPDATFHLPRLLHGSNPEPEAAMASYMDFMASEPKTGSLLIGLSMGGLLAAKASEVRGDLTAVALSSPTSFGDLHLQAGVHPGVHALYSSTDSTILGRTDWSKYTSSEFDRDWLHEHRLDNHFHQTVLLLQEFIRTMDFAGAVRLIDSVVSNTLPGL